MQLRQILSIFAKKTILPFEVIFHSTLADFPGRPHIRDTPGSEPRGDASTGQTTDDVECQVGYGTALRAGVRTLSDWKHRIKGGSIVLPS